MRKALSLDSSINSANAIISPVAKRSRILEVIANAGLLLLIALQVKMNIFSLRNVNKRLKETETRLQECDQLKRNEKFRENCQQFNLTSREQEIAFLVYTGVTYKEIAKQLFIAERTVSKHVQHIFDKMSVSNKAKFIYKIGA